MKLLSGPLIVVMVLLSSSVFGGEESHHAHMHAHGQIEVADFEKIPGVALEVTKDAVGGWNIHLLTRNFTFAPERVNSEPAVGEGHAHLYVDGEKVARLYGEWFHLGRLTSGRHIIKVTLNANDHAELVLHGEQIVASQAVVE